MFAKKTTSKSKDGKVDNKNNKKNKKKISKQKIANAKVPKTVQDCIPYNAVYEGDGIIETKPGIFTKSYLLQDVNYQIAKQMEQEEMFQRYGELLNSFDPSIKVQITINNKNVDQKDFEKSTLLKLQQDNLDELRYEYNEMLKKKMSEGKNNLMREKYLTLSIEAESYQSAVTQFARLDGEVAGNVKRIGGSSANPLATETRLEILHDIYNLGSEGMFGAKLIIDDKESKVFSFENVKRMGITTKDCIAPMSFEFKKDYMIIGDKYARAVFLTDFPTLMTDKIIAELTDTNFNMVTSINLESVYQDKALKIIKNQMVNINSNMIDRQKRASKSGYSIDLISPELKNAQNEANELLEDMTSKNQKMFLMTLVIVHFADDLEALDRDTETLESIARRFLCQIKSLNWQQKEGLNSALPLAKNELFVQRTLTTESTAVFMPFVSQELQQKNGMYYGLNAVSRNMIMFNRMNSKNGNGFILGTPGCVDKDTEFFNGKEWKSIADYQEGEQVLQFNTDTNEASLVIPERYIKAPCDKMYHFETKYGIDQTLSEEHRVIYYSRRPKTNTYSEAKEMSAKELADMQNSGKFRGKFKTDFKYNGPGIELTDIEIKLMLAVICDGSFNKNNPDSLNCRFNLKKSRKKNELFKLLKEYGEEFNIYENDDGYTQYSVHVPKREKVFMPYWYNCNARQLQLICDNIIQWDGYIDNIGRRAFSTTSKENADFVQFAFSACGYRATISVNDRVGETHITNNKEYTRKSVEYEVCISDNVMVGMEWHNDGRTTNTVVKEIVPEDGYKYCFTVPTHALVLRRNGKIFITGNSGKSFSAKREMLNVLLNTNDDVIVIDPEREYGPMAELLGGEVVKIATGSPYHINPLDMDADYADEQDPVTLKSDFLLSICETVLGGRYGLTPTQRSIIDRCCRLVYADFLKTYNSATGKYDERKIPTLLDFQRLLEAQSEREAREIAIALELYTKGSQDFFAHKTNVETDARFVVYDIKDIGKNIQTMGMLVVLDSIWNRIIKNRRKGRKTWFYIDEIYLLFANETSAQFLKELYKRARKWGGIPTGITQNVEDLLMSETARTMISNCEFIMMLNQAPLDREELAHLLNISETQLSYITNSNPGEGLIYTGNSIIPFIDKFPQNGKLYAAMTTKVDEIKKEFR